MNGCMEESDPIEDQAKLQIGGLQLSIWQVPETVCGPFSSLVQEGVGVEPGVWKRSVSVHRALQSAVLEASQLT